MCSWTGEMLPLPLWTTLSILLLVYLYCSHRIVPLILRFLNTIYGLHDLITHSHSFSLSNNQQDPFHHPRNHHTSTSLPTKSLQLSPTDSAPRIYYPGLINSSSNLCFLNAVLQSLASMPHVVQYLNLIQSYGVPYTPVANTLREMLVALNTPREHQAVLKPFSVAQALLGHPSGQRSMLFNSEQQDAQEFLVTMIDALEAEAKLLAEHLRLNHHSIRFNGLDRNQFCQEARKIRRSPFRGLMAHRIACATCGFTSVIRHSSADHFSLNVPPKTTCKLESCLQEYTKLEVLDEYICRKCSLKKTYDKLATQLEQVQQRQTGNKKKQVSAIKKKLGILKSAIVEDPEREMPGQIGIERVASLATTKQTMFARPPDSLTFHISRSTAYARGVSFKNHCQVIYPEELILDPYCTTYSLSGDATQPISSHPRPTTTEYRYRLSSVVVHFGSHSFGHYITYRKSPNPAASRYPHPSSSTSSKDDVNVASSNHSWYRISDETVQLSSVDDALRSNPFLLMYERVLDPLHQLDSLSSSDDDDISLPHLNSSSSSLISTDHLIHSKAREISSIDI